MASLVTKVCEICSASYQVIYHRKNVARYCSRPCYYKAMTKKGSIQKSCKSCGTVFLTSPSRTRVFCSNKCRGIGQRVDAYKHSASLPKALRRRGRMTACEQCGYDTEPSILGVHHIDMNHSNNALSNLIVLCPNCHSIAHMKHTPH